MYRKQLTLIILMFFFLITQVVAGTTGEGRAVILNNNNGAARQQALLNAKRDAVEKGVGLFLDSKSLTENWRLIQDEIYTTARGFITKFSIVNDAKSPDGKEWLITIDAEVATESIKNKLTELRILHQKMGNKKVAVVFHPVSAKALSKTSKAIVDSKAKIEQTFNNAGFRVTHFPDLEEQVNSFEEIIAKASEKNIHILIEFDLSDSSPVRTVASGVSVAKAEVSLNIWNLSTGRQIASTQSFKKQFMKGQISSYNWDNVLSKAGKKAGEEAATESIKKIVDYYKEVGDIGNSFLILFQNYSEDDSDKMIGVLENLDGFQSLNELETSPGMVQVEYFTSLTKSRLRRLLRSEVKKLNIQLQSKMISGNRLSFIKPGTE